MITGDIIMMAREAGFDDYAFEARNLFERFAQLVAAQEREECAKILEANAERCSAMMKDILIANAAAIRARGEK